MATRSTISKVNNDGTITSIYCHWDGYYSNNGKLLLENYNEEKKLDELLSLGSLSSLEKDTKTTVAYYRDRGESELTVTKFSCKPEFNLTKSFREEYNYLWENGQWFCALNSQDNFIPLTIDMCKEQ